MAHFAAWRHTRSAEADDDDVRAMGKMIIWYVEYAYDAERRRDVSPMSLILREKKEEFLRLRAAAA